MEKPALKQMTSSLKAIRPKPDFNENMKPIPEKRQTIVPILVVIMLAELHCFNQIVLGPPGSQKPRLVPVSVYSEEKKGCFSGSSASPILLLPIKGTILNEIEYNRPGASPAAVQAVLEAAESNTAIKTVLLQIDSPGGAVGASDLIYELIRKAAEKRKYRVYAHIDDLGASGAYYAAMSAAVINARPTALVGSIGVIIRGFELTGLLSKTGIKYRAIKTGKNKDTLSPFREMTKEEEEYFLKEIDYSYERFLNIVLEGRKGKISESALRAVADGRIMNANSAKKAGLIDEVSYLEDYLQQIKKKENYSSIEVIAFLPPQQSNYSLYDVRPDHTEEWKTMVNEILKSRSGMYYLWEPAL